MTDKYLRAIKRAITDLIADLRNGVLKNYYGDLISVETVINNATGQTIMDHYINRVLPWKDKIENRDEKFFLENKFIFVGLSPAKVEFYSQYLSNPDNVEDDDKELIFQHFDTMTEIAELYNKHK